MNVRAITFDLDDTLWPVEPVLIAAERVLWAWIEVHCPRVVSVVGQEGLQTLREQVLDEFAPDHSDFSAMRVEILRRAMRAADYHEDRAHDAFDVFFRERNRVDLYDDVAPTLDALRDRYSLGAISNGNADLTLTGVDRWIAVGISARQVGVPKPSPEIFAAAAEALGASADEILHVGDHPELDAHAARSAGFQSVWLNRRGVPWDGPGDPPLEIESLGDLVALLASD